MANGERFHVARWAAEDRAELLLLVAGGVWAPIEFVASACRYERPVAERLAEVATVSGHGLAFVVRAACDCARCVRSSGMAAGRRVQPAGPVVVIR